MSNWAQFAWAEVPWAYDPATLEPGLYTQFQRDLAPPWLQDSKGARFLESLGYVKDLLVEDTRQALFARLIAVAPEDALTALGSERGIERAPGEALDAYRSRVLKAWGFWEQGGTVPGLISAFAAAGYIAWIYEWFRSNTAIWSEFNVYVRSSNPAYTSWRWGSGIIWGSGIGWNNLSPTEPQRIIRIAQQMKPAHTKVREYVIMPPGAKLWGSDWSWSDGTKWTQAIHIPG